MKKLARLAVAVSAFGFASLPAFSASKEDVKEVMAMALDHNIPYLVMSSDFSDEDIVVTTVVFVEGDLRYTMDFEEKIDSDYRALRFAVRKNGSTAPTLLNTVSDLFADGKVDSGTDGVRNKLFELIPPDDPEDETIGPEHEAYWQEEYDKAIAAALAYKKRVGK